ncbi:transporter substrate-binding domain-containing protein [Mangrovicoccus algicola]|uniref:Transporter substrate-binding domain-containing protein n=1 Tax=Mangrovicoccus algicola TaxID=2771008 RepID=A0A8J6YT20_9RHOB|nr:transporter substrate-binding domain-containing protein [Mangrovicoccus algicola]MBE3636937.1 transporter substrate-binding domain-containing protein [Mangrovicoccus algicola]
MKKLLLGTVLLTATAGMAAAQDVVRIGTEGAYPPYNFINDANEVDGYDIDVANEVCARAELTCEWVTNDWDSIIPNLVSGNYDAIAAGMSITDERDEVIDFTQAYYPPDPSAYAGLDEIDVTSAVVAAQAATIQATHVAESGATLVEFATPDESVAAVRNGEADAVLADKGFLVPIVEEDPDLVFIGEDVMLGKGIGIGLRESDTELKEKMDAALASMKEDGKMAELLEKWFPGMDPDF